MQKNFLAAAALAFFLLQACSSHPPVPALKSATDTIPVRVMVLASSDQQESLAVSGKFTTEDETLLSFKTGGIIRQILVKEGDRVVPGQLLASLDLTEINTRVQQAGIAFEKAERDYKRASNLYRDSVATLEQLQNSQTAQQIAAQQLAAARFNLTYSGIRATRNGYILRKLAGEGQLVDPGTPIFQVNGAGKGSWVLKAGLSDRQWSAVRKGDKASITTDLQGGKTLEAVVTAKSEGVDPATGTLSVDCRLTGSFPEGLAAGLFGRAIIYPTQKIRSWQVPYDAILDGDAGEGYVFVTDDRQTARKIKISIGAIRNGSVLVTGGLENAKALIVSGSAYLNEGSPIKIVQ